MTHHQQQQPIDFSSFKLICVLTPVEALRFLNAFELCGRPPEMDTEDFIKKLLFDRIEQIEELAKACETSCSREEVYLEP